MQYDEIKICCNCSKFKPSRLVLQIIPCWQNIVWFYWRKNIPLIWVFFHSVYLAFYQLHFLNSYSFFKNLKPWIKIYVIMKWWLKIVNTHAPYCTIINETLRVYYRVTSLRKRRSETYYSTFFTSVKFE